MRQPATTADIMGQTVHNLSWVCVGSDEEHDATVDAADAPADIADRPAVAGGGDGGLDVK